MADGTILADLTINLIGYGKTCSLHSLPYFPPWHGVTMVTDSHCLLPPGPLLYGQCCEVLPRQPHVRQHCAPETSHDTSDTHHTGRTDCTGSDMMYTNTHRLQG